MLKVLLFSQNVKLKSLTKYKQLKGKDDSIIYLTTHYLFANEREFLSNLFNNCGFIIFADLLSDSEMEKCDINAYNSDDNAETYYLKIKYLKNETIARKLKIMLGEFKGYIFSDDLGILKDVWLQHGFEDMSAEYYYESK